MELTNGFTSPYRRGRQLGDPSGEAARRLTEVSGSLNGNCQNLLSSWLPPGGSCHDEISASRNRYFVVTDEGWRWLKVLDFPVEWRKQEHMPSSCIQKPAFRRPSSVFFANRFRSAACQKIQLSNFGMIAPGNHNFERFAALCNTLSGEPRRLRRSGRQLGAPY